jgi:hypothetical protein
MAARLEQALPLRRMFLKSPKGASSQSPGLSGVLCRSTLGMGYVKIYPERVEFGYNPFRVENPFASLPRVGRKRRGQPWALGGCPVV